MSAQYRPYRDEESVDGLEATWSDNEPGSVQIYEKTTEDLPFSSVKNKTIWFQIASLLTVGALGFVLGYLSTSHSDVSSDKSSTILNDTSGSWIPSDRESHILFEDATIKDKILSKLNGDNILELIKEFDDMSRLPGSSGDKKLAQEIERRMKSYNFDQVLEIEDWFKTLIPSKRSSIKLLKRNNETIYYNIYHELADDISPFLPLSQANSTTIYTDQIIYVNKGTPKDYSTLGTELRLNDTDGKVFVIRQGHYKAHDTVITAQRLGATAVLLFPDPDIYGSNSPFPESVRLPKDAARAHPTAWSNYGDLVSNSTKLLDLLRLERDQRVNIPVIPISFITAQEILRGLSGPEAPIQWNCFDFTLYVGPGYQDLNNLDDRNKIQIDFHNEEISISSPTITGMITGSSEPDRYVIIGSRRDSLNRGILDSLSGSAIMLEIARVFGHLLKNGWRPKRSIIFNSFGAETFNLIGSSYWIEHRFKLLHSRAVAYINCDIPVIGNQAPSIAASPLLFQVIYNATRQATNPIADKKVKTVYDAWKASRSYNSSVEAIIDLATQNLLNILDKVPESSAMENDSGFDGSGTPGSILHQFRLSSMEMSRPNVRMLDTQSMYSPFFLSAGMPVVDVRYSYSSKKKSNISLLADTIPILGTRYDNMTTLKLIDPDMKFHLAVSQVLAEMIRDLTDSVYLPFNLFDYSLTISRGYHMFKEKYGNTLQKTFQVDFKALENVINEFTQAAARFHHKQDLIGHKDILKVRQMNDQLMQIERVLVDSSGSSSHNDNKHLILPSNEGSDTPNSFPALIDWLGLLDAMDFNDPDDEEHQAYKEVLSFHYKTIVHTISNVIQLIDNFETLSTHKQPDENVKASLKK